MPVVIGPIVQGDALVDVAVAVPAPRAQALARARLPVPAPLTLRGVLDTAARYTILDASIRRSLPLVPFNALPLLTPSSGPNPPSFLLYKIDLAVLHPAGNLTKNLLAVFEADVAHLGAEVILGWDVLADCRLVYDGRAGRFWLDY